MGRLPLLVGTWLLATVLATTLAWGAVRQVEQRVTDQAPVLSQAGVENAARPRGGALGASDIPTTTTAPPAAPGAAVTPGSGPGGAQTPSRGSSGGSMTGASSPPPAAAPVTEPTPPPPPTPRVTSLVAVGGTASFRCSDGDARLVSAQPRSGFTAATPPGNPSAIEFTSPTHKSVIDAECVGDAVRGYVEEEAL